MANWQGYYSTAQVSRLARVPLRTLYEWKERDIIKPSVELISAGLVAEQGYSYADLTIVKIMKALRDDRLDLESVGVALKHLFQRLGPRSRGWTDAHVYIVGNKVYAEKPDGWDMTTATQFGQRIETRLFGGLFEELRSREEPGEILVPPDFSDFVEINPDIMGGEPVVKGTRIPTSMLALLKKRGRSFEYICQLYKPLTLKQAKGAVGYEQFLDSAITEPRTPVVGHGR